jgi:hypothetical protein
MKTLPMVTHVVDLTTGETTERITDFKILPPVSTACQICGHEHTPDQPHNAQSLYYQYAFYGEHGRWPTWKDAVQHCADDVKSNWERELRKAGVWPE